MDSYKFYCKRDEWKDVVPLKQNEHERSAARINYSDKFVDVYNYIRAVMVADERSERVLKLTEDALNLNPANYSVWFYRRNILATLKSDLRNELIFVSECIEENQKNYQVWYHRQWIVDELIKQVTSLEKDGDGSGAEEKKGIVQDELLFTEGCLYDDSKNYHVWQYRHWLVDRCRCYEDELRFTDKMLGQDCYNNSAWNHRYYVISAMSAFTDSVLMQETDYVFKYIRMAPENESSWSYLDGLYRKKQLHTVDRLEKFCLELIDDKEACKSPYMHSFYLEILLSKLKSIEMGENEQRGELVHKALGVCDRLAGEVDRIRVNYWKYRAVSIDRQYSADNVVVSS